VLLARDHTVLTLGEKCYRKAQAAGLELRLFLHCRIEPPGGFEEGWTIQLLVSHAA
jgi:hypothetical protein